jgi:hypothetical protein
VAERWGESTPAGLLRGVDEACSEWLRTTKRGWPQNRKAGVALGAVIADSHEQLQRLLTLVGEGPPSEGLQTGEERTMDY